MKHRAMVAVGNLGPSQWFGANSVLNADTVEPYTLIATTQLSLLVIDALSVKSKCL